MEVPCSIRGDYTINDKTHLFGRFSRFTDTLTGTTIFGPAGGAGFGLGGYGGTSIGANDSAAAGVDIVVNPKLVTDIRLGYFRYDINTASQGVTMAAPFLGGAGNGFVSGNELFGDFTALYKIGKWSFGPVGYFEAQTTADKPGKGVAYDPPEPNQWDSYQDFGHSHWHNSLIWGEGLSDIAICGPGLICW